MESDHQLVIPLGKPISPTPPNPRNSVLYIVPMYMKREYVFPGTHTPHPGERSASSAI